MNIDFELDLSEKVNALPLSDADKKRVVDIVFWAMEQVAAPKVASGVAIPAEPEPLKEPVNIAKALRAHRDARPVVDGSGSGKACVMLVNIQVQGWWHTAESAKQWADGYNMGCDHMRHAYGVAIPAPGSAAAPFGMEPDDHEYDELGLPDPDGVAPTPAPRRYYCNKCGSYPDTVEHNRPDGSPCPYMPRFAPGVMGTLKESGNG